LYCSEHKVAAIKTKTIKIKTIKIDRWHAGKKYLWKLSKTVKKSIHFAMSTYVLIFFTTQVRNTFGCIKRLEC
jgi:hypothetical protein